MLSSKKPKVTGLKVPMVEVAVAYHALDDSDNKWGDLESSLSVDAEVEALLQRNEFDDSDEIVEPIGQPLISGGVDLVPISGEQNEIEEKGDIPDAAAELPICGICFDPMDAGSWVSCIGIRNEGEGCEFMSHLRCLRRWINQQNLANHDKCPVCRRQWTREMRDEVRRLCAIHMGEAVSVPEVRPVVDDLNIDDEVKAPPVPWFDDRWAPGDRESDPVPASFRLDIDAEYHDRCKWVTDRWSLYIAKTPWVYHQDSGLYEIMVKVGRNDQLPMDVPVRMREDVIIASYGPVYYVQVPPQGTLLHEASETWKHVDRIHKAADIVADRKSVV